MADNSAEISSAKKTPSETSDKLFRSIVEWLVVFGTNHRVEVNPAIPKIWQEAFKDLTAEQFEMACSKTIQTSKFFPSIADIREAVSGSIANQGLAEAEAAWTRVLRYANRWHPDCDPPRGISLNCSEARSLDFAGGIHMLWSLQDEGGTELAFMRKAFVESYMRRDAVDLAIDNSEQHRLGSEGMKSIKEIIGGMPKSKEPEQ